MSAGIKQLRQAFVALIASPPGVNDDALQNYMVGSTVYSISDQTFYECSDATIGAAVWAAVSFGTGTVNTGSQYRIPYYSDTPTGTTLSEAAAITANRALISDANGVPTHSPTTAAQLAYLQGISSPANGDIFYFDGTNIVRLAAGSQGSPLQMGATVPEWGYGEMFDYITPGDGNFSTMSDTMQSITPLSMPVVANGVYRFVFGGKVGCDNTGGAQMSLSMPTGAEAIVEPIQRSSGPTAGTFQGTRISSGTQFATFATANSEFAMSLQHGMIQVGANAGNVIPQIKAVTAGQTVTVYEYAWFLLKRVA